MNGKALVNGVDLLEMGATEAVDVIHYFFEEDLKVSSAEEADAKSEVRLMLYRQLYNTQYKYAVKSGGSSGSGGGSLPSDGFFGEDPTPFDPTTPRTVKPYTPPTEFDADSPLPFGGLLDAPVGG